MQAVSEEYMQAVSEEYMQAVSEEKRVAQDLVFRGLLRGGSTQHPSAPSETV
jgi:hypothetical protein